MKKILKSLVFGFVALFGAAQIVAGFSYGGDTSVLVFAALVFGAANSLLKPILKLVTLPLNILTLGLFSLVINAALLFLTIRLVSGLTIAGFYFAGLVIRLPFGYPPLVIPPLNISSVVALFITSLVISIFMITLGIIFGDE